MSPLARSLLAFAALLAPANAKITPLLPLPGGYCLGFIMDIPPRPYNPTKSAGGYKFTMMSDGTSPTLKVIPNNCGNNKEIARQKVEVCNDYPHPTTQRFAPRDVHALGDDVPSPVYASCGDDTECGPLFWKIEQECRERA